MMRTRPPFSDYRVGNLEFWKLTPVTAYVLVQMHAAGIDIKPDGLQ